MRVTPKSEKEIQEANLLPKGVYPFTVAGAEETTSKKGNEMLVLNLKVYRGDGFTFVKDFLMDTELGAYRIRRVAEACGAMASYDAGNLEPDDLLNKEGWVKIGIKKDKAGQYADQNAAFDYYKDEPKKEESETKAERAPRDPEDDIPFKS